MRTFSSNALRAIFQSSTSEAFLILLEINEATLTEPIRVTSDAVNTVSQDELYVAFPFQISLPADEETQTPQVRLTIDNVDRQIVEALRRATSKPTVTMRVVLASSPDTVELGPLEFEMDSGEYNTMTVSATLVFNSWKRRAMPRHKFTPALFPAGF